MGTGASSPSGYSEVELLETIGGLYDAEARKAFEYHGKDDADGVRRVSEKTCRHFAKKRPWLLDADRVVVGNLRLLRAARLGVEKACLEHLGGACLKLTDRRGSGFEADEVLQRSLGDGQPVRDADGLYAAAKRCEEVFRHEVGAAAFRAGSETFSVLPLKSRGHAARKLK